jgi:hypothetical protein
MGPARRREPGEHDGDSSAQSTARRDRMCDRHSRAEQLRLHTGPRGARVSGEGAAAFVWARLDNRAPLGSGLGGQRRIATYDGFSTQVTRTLRARVSGHTPG